MGTLLLSLLLAMLIGYALGSIPFGLLLTKAAGLGDVRNIGSGNIGATNVLRTGNKALAAVTLLLDMLKGTAAVLITTWLAANVFHLPQTLPSFIGLVGGLGAFLGHLFPLWLKFKGGKGVATYIGVLLGATPLLALIFCGIWLLVAFTTRYSSLAALVASIALPFIALLLPRFVMTLFEPSLLFAVLLAMSALLVWKHRENIARLKRGEETKIGQRG